MAIEVDIYEKIRYYHEQEGKSQRAIAKILGISRNTVKKYYDGSHVPWERQGISGRRLYISHIAPLNLELPIYFVLFRIYYQII